jgi:saccharopine dehydrogenase (NAD+, L-lysine forming)
MTRLKIGLIREGKIPPDKRVPFTPLQAEEIEQRFANVQVVCQTSPIRCFTDDEYLNQDINVSDDVSDCEILMGIKEVPIQSLIPGKTYLFFSHTLKKQPYNRKLLQAALSKNIRLIDYEALKDKQGNRLVAFGRFAGIVGAYNGLWTYGNRYNKFSLRRAYDCFDVNDLKLELEKVKLPPIKILLTGSGRVAKGAMETLDSARIRKVSIHDFLYRKFEQPVYIQLSSGDYHTRKAGGHFNREEFHHYPDRYFSHFADFTKVTDVLLAGAYWNPKAPVLFTREDMLASDFRIRIIADITCDINGSIPSTKRPSTIPDPIYDYDTVTNTLHPPFTNDSFVSVMAVDNLPCELPRSSSEEFGRDLIDRILKPLLEEDSEGIIKRATITAGGQLTSYFEYLRDYASGAENDADAAT